jgi:hypothetical protein
MLIHQKLNENGNAVKAKERPMNDCLSQHYRCPDRYLRFAHKGTLPAVSGYFQFGEGVTCYGSYYGHPPAEVPSGTLHDATADVVIQEGTAYLPFDPSQVANNLRSELYVGEWRHSTPMSALAKMYYFLRPALPVAVRRHLQKLHLRGWDKAPFPRWPVDCSVDQMLERLLLLALKANRVERIPLIWFWPEGASSCAIMTHDVESELGRDFCGKLMDLDDSFGIKSSFQVIPEQRYQVTQKFLDSIRQRGFEVVVHDLNHDGHLYRNRAQFLERAARINAYGRAYGASGFRAGILYRKQLWYDALEFAYDMSVPNVAHLDPQHGGCCTVMPYFLGNILELPVTTTQDYTLFNILGDYSLRLWQQQIGLIMERHGLMSFIAHPDYIAPTRERRIYEELLGQLAQLRKNQGVWITTPGEVNLWWRQRAEMRLVEEGEGWRIEGPCKQRARVAYASEKGGQLVLTLQAENDVAVHSVGRFS